MFFVKRIYRTVAIAIIATFLLAPSIITSRNIEKIDNCLFGTGYNGHFFCTPVYSGRPGADVGQLADRFGVDISSILPDDNFFEFPADSLDFIKSRIGDTLQMFYSGGLRLVLVDAVGYYMGACHTDWLCRLRPLEPVADSSLIYFFLLPIKDQYSGIVAKYQKMDSDDPALARLVDSLRQELIKEYIDYAESNNYRIIEPPSRINSAVYVLDSSTGKGEIFLNFDAFTGSTEASWCSLYRLKKAQKEWEISTVRPPEYGPMGGYRFQCAFDLDHDGNLEYLLTPGGGAVIYNIIDDSLIIRCGSGYWGC